MTSPALQLDIDELLSALEVIDPVDVLIEELISRAAGGEGQSPTLDGRLTPWRRRTPAEGAPATELVLLEDLGVGGRCVLPKSVLYTFRTASLVALAARELTVPGVVTGAMLGFDFTAQTSLALITRYLPGLSHVAVCPKGDGSNGLNGPMQPRIIDQLDLSGVDWSVTTAVAEAVFGATLVVVTAARVRWSEFGHLAKGSVLINATGKDLPDHLVDVVDQIYVDDAALIYSNPHRYFARLHMAERSADPAWDRADFRRYRGIEADFAQILAGAHAGRTHVDHILLVELLGARELDVPLACALHRAALDYGLGVWLIE